MPGMDAIRCSLLNAFVQFSQSLIELIRLCEAVEKGTLQPTTLISYYMHFSIVRVINKVIIEAVYTQYASATANAGLLSVSATTSSAPAGGETNSAKTYHTNIQALHVCVARPPSTRPLNVHKHWILTPNAP